LTPFKLHAGFVISMAVLSPLFYWPEYGSMFTGPAVAPSVEVKASAKDMESEATTVPSKDQTPASLASVVPKASV
jgi:hypothetical protein